MPMKRVADLVSRTAPTSQQATMGWLAPPVRGQVCNVSSLIAVRQKRRPPVLSGLLLLAAAAEALLVHLGRSYGSTALTNE